MADYNGVYKDMCAKEFLRLKDCYLVSFFLLLFLKRGGGGDGGGGGGGFMCIGKEARKGFS